MSKIDAVSTLLDYLLAWFGLVGGAVGLYVPSIIAQKCSS
jgi:hypothetical protein